MVSDESDRLRELHRPVTVEGYDEMVGPDGDLRDHWRYVIGSLRMLGGAELVDRHDEVARLLRQDGSAYDAARATSVNGPGPLDLIPLLVSSEDWSRIESGLVQRAELLDLVLDDLYGEQILIQRGIIPVEAVHLHPGYLRAVHGDATPGEHRLVHYSAELTRRRDGQMVVLADRTRIPAGSGEVLENRLALSRVFPSLFRDAHTHRLAHYFLGVRRGLNAIAPADRDDPRIVILTPGPEHPSYFEHSYLASYLGFPLAEPADLTVRRGRVWLRAVGGLQQIDVVMRGISDELCDPLELKSGTGTGVPGLVEAARRGTVAIANPIGSAAAENPALIPFLPAAADHLLGTSLLLDSVDTWWCGRSQDLELVLSELDSMVLSRIDRYGPSVHGSELSDKLRSSLVDEIRTEPRLWVGQRLPDGGWVPNLIGSQIESRPCTIRAFLTAREGSYTAMPGGFGRIPAPGGPVRVPHPLDPPDSTWAKDVWVLASEPERPGTSLISDTDEQRSGALVQPQVRSAAGPLPSRAAEHLFWLGRYGERSEQTIRWARSVLSRVSDAADQGDDTSPLWLDDLVRGLLTVTGAARSGGITEADGAEPSAVVLDAVFPADGAGLVSTIARMSGASLTVRELLSADTWQVIDAMDDEVNRVRRFPPANAAAAQRVLSGILTSLFALNGLAAESTVRDAVWLFLDAGQRLERAQLLVASSRAALVPVRDPDADALVHESVLTANDSLITYRRRYRARLRIGSVLELLLGDASNPRSLVYQLDRLSEHAAHLPASDDQRASSEVAERIAAVSHLLSDADLATVATVTSDGRRSELDELFRQATTLLGAVGEALGRHFLHVDQPRDLDQAGG